MKINLFKYILILIFITTYSFALDDENKDLNLIAPKKLNKIKGKKEPLKVINKKEIIGDYSSPKVSKGNIEKGKIDLSDYKQVKLIDTVLETLSRTDLLKSARERVIQYELKLKNAVADYYPTIDAEYNYGKTRSTPSGEEGNRFKFYKDNNYRVVLRQNIYAGGATLNNVKSIEKKLEVAKNQYKNVLDKEIKKAIKAYFGVVFANRSVMVNERNMKKLKKILEIVTIKYENGAASIGDLTSIKANVANAMTKLVKVNSKFIESLRYYEYIVGVNFEKTLPYERNFDVDVSNFDELYKRALENNKDLINYYKSIEDEKFIQKRAKAKFRPKVDFELSYKKSTAAEDLDEEESDLNGKIKLSYNIFNGGRDKNKVLESNSKIRDLNYKLSEEKRKLKWNLSKIYTSISSVSKALDSTIAEIKASRKMVSSYWDTFKLGEQDLNTLLQGQRQLNAAETELVNYEKSNITDFFNILELTGDLSSFFDVDPENSRFIDFSSSDYKRVILPKDGDSIDLDLNTGKKIKKEEVEKNLLEEKEKIIKDIPLPEPSINDNIKKFQEDFLNFDDDSYMIEISSFGNIYDSFDFIKENNFDTNSFSYDVVKLYNIETRIAHNNFKTILEAKAYLEALEAKKLNKKYEIRKVKDIKVLYNKYLDGLKIEVKKTKPKIKIVEKIRQAIKKEEFETNLEFKNKFLNSKDSAYTINISSFTNIDSVEAFIIKNDIYEESFFFKYGDNGQLIKLVFGIYKDYNKDLEEKVNSFIIENANIFPIVEKISSIKRQFNNNLDLNTKKVVPVEYEYINVSKKDLIKIPTKNEKIKNQKIKSEKIKEEKLKLKNIENEEILTITKRPSLDDIDKDKKKVLKEIKNELESILPKNKNIDKIKEEVAEEKKLAELKREEELRLTKLAEEKRLEKVRLSEEKRLTELKKQEDLRLAKIAEEKRLEKARLIKEEKAILEAQKKKELKLSEEKKLAELKREEELRLIKEEKAKVEAKLAEELRLTKLAEEKRLEKARLLKEEKARLEAQKKLEVKLAKEKRLEKVRLEAQKKSELKLSEEKKLAELKKQEELRLAKLAKEKRLEKVRLSEEKRLIELKRQEEIKLAKLAEEKRLEKARLLKEEKARLEAQKKLEVKLAEELRLAKLVEEKRLEKARLIKEEKASIDAQNKIEKRLAEEKRLTELKIEKNPTKMTFSNKEIEEIDFANGLKDTPKKVEIPYATRLKNFKKKFDTTSKNNYTLKLITIDSNKVKWYTHRFGLDPNYVLIEKNANKSTIYYGIFNTKAEARAKTETLHPLIYESKPLVEKIGSVR